MLRGNHYASKEVLSRKDYLDKVCRSFASRLELRRDIVNLSLSFHQNSSVVGIKSREQEASVRINVDTDL